MTATVYFDFVDPGSYLTFLQLERLGTDPAGLEWTGVELAVPPSEMVDPAADDWILYCEAVDELARKLDRTIARPDFIPWTRKAHELAVHGRTEGIDLVGPLFRAHFREDRDLGRVDVLTEIAVAAGLERTETKAVLDVDKYTEDVVRARAEALEAGIARVPTVVRGGRSLVGPAPMGDLQNLFDSPAEGAPDT